jgi:hypothetical protein
MKSGCNEYQKKIAGSFLEDLSEKEREQLEAHLAACPYCRSEQAGYAEALELMKTAGDGPVPRHFFVRGEDQSLSPWGLFRHMKPLWRAATAAIAALLLLVCTAAITRLQIRSGPPGWAISFGGTDIEVLRSDILKAAEAQSLQSMNTRLQEVRVEMRQSNAAAALHQRDYLAAELSHLDSRLEKRIARAEGNLRSDAQALIYDVYQAVSRQRAQDFEIMNLRFDAMEANNAVKARQTNDILGTLLQVAEMRLVQTGEQK